MNWTITGLRIRITAISADICSSQIDLAYTSIWYWVFCLIEFSMYRRILYITFAHFIVIFASVMMYLADEDMVTDRFSILKYVPIRFVLLDMSSVKVANKAVQYILAGPAPRAVNNLENPDLVRITNQEIDIEEHK